MSVQCEIAAKQIINNDPLGFFGRYLTIWVALSIVVGIGLGNLFPYWFNWLSHLEIGHVNLLVAILIWVMIYPMIVNVDLNSLRHKMISS